MQPDTSYQSRKAPFGLKAALYSLVTSIGLAGSASAQEPAPQDLPPLDRRPHTPVIYESPLRLEWPPRMANFRVAGRHDPTSSGTGIEGVFTSPYAGLDARYIEGTSRDVVHRGMSLLGGVGVVGESADIEFVPHYEEGVAKDRSRRSSSSTDAAGLLNETDETETRVLEDRRYSLAFSTRIPLSFREPVGRLGDVRVMGYLARREEEDETSIDGSTHVSGTITIPGVPQPVIIDTTAPYTARVRVRRTTAAFDLGMVYSLATFSAVRDLWGTGAISELALGPWFGYHELSARANQFDGTTDSRILEDSTIRRSYGAQLIFESGDAADLRFFLAGRAGADGIDHSARFTGQGVFAMSFRPTDLNHQVTLAAQASGRGGVERYAGTFALMRLGDAGQSTPDLVASRAKHRVYALEQMLVREAGLSSGHDERFSPQLARRLRLDLYQFDAVAIGALMITGGYEKGSLEGIGGDRVFGIASVPLDFFGEGMPPLAFMVYGSWGHDARSGNSHLQRRDYDFGAGLSWTPHFNDWDLGLFIRAERTGTPGGLDTSVVGGIQLGFGGQRSTFDRVIKSLEDQRTEPAQRR